MRIPARGLPAEDTPVPIGKVAARWRTRQWHVRWKLTEARIPIFKAILAPVDCVRWGDLLKYEEQIREMEEMTK